MRNFHNRLTKLENVSPQNLAGIIIYISNVIYESNKDKKGQTHKEIISGDFRISSEDAEVLTLEELQEWRDSQPQLRYITYFPIRQKPEDIQFVELHHDI